MVTKVAEAKELTEEDYKAMADEAALKWKIATSTLRNMAYSESRWNPNAESKTGDCGIVQLNTKYTGVPCEKAKDPVFALDYAAEQISKGKEYLWVPCSCVKTLKALGVKAPTIDAKWFKPNTTPHVGAVAIFKYKNVSHVALVKELKENYFVVREGNFTPCLITNRRIKYGDAALVGFWSPDPSM